MSDVTEAKPGVWSRRLKAIAGELGAFLALILIVAYFSFADKSGSFASVRNLRVLLEQTSIVAVAALGMTLIIISGGIDLSAGTAVTLSATMMAYCLKEGYSPLVTLLATVGIGGLCGLINGLLISGVRIVPFIVTLGSMTIFLGLGKLLSNSTTLRPPPESIPEWVKNLRSTRGDNFVDIAGVSIPNIASGVWIALGLALFVSFLLRYTVFGRHVFALGSNESTARLCGVNVFLTKTLVYSLAGLFVGIAGVYQFAALKMGNPTEGIGLELKFIAAVVIGGGSLNGGRGSVLGTLCGAAIMGVIVNGCIMLEVPNPYQDILIGLIIIAAVTLDQVRQGKISFSTLFRN